MRPKQVGDLVDVADEQQAQPHADARADDAQAQAVAQEDAHDAAARGAERFQDADVAGLLDDDHEEDRQDAEAGHGDDQEQQHVEHGRFHLHRGQQRALLVAPRC